MQIEYLSNSRRLLVLQVQNLIVYDKIEKNLNIHYPNLFNLHQSVLWQNTGTERWPWGQSFSHNYTRLWVCYGVQGLLMYDLSHLPTLTLLKTYKTGYELSTTILFLERDPNIAYLSIQTFGIRVLNFTDFDNPIVISSIALSGETDHFTTTDD